MESIILIFNLYFSIYMYITMFIFTLIFLYSINFYNILNNSINFSLLYTNNFKKINLFLFIGTFVGIPPLLGFFAKALLFVNLLFFQKYLFFIILILINVFLMVFYLQQLRFLQSNFKKNFFLKTKLLNNYKNYSLIITFQLINVFSCLLIPFLFKLFLLFTII